MCQFDKGLRLAAGESFEMFEGGDFGELKDALGDEVHVQGEGWDGGGEGHARSRRSRLVGKGIATDMPGIVPKE
jgi:hypothetical protein